MEIKVAPSILSADFAKLGEEIKKVEPYSDMLHVDVMDGHFVPNLCLGPVIIESIKPVTKLPIEAHLMIENPEKYIDDYVKAGADIITVHAEACKDLKAVLKQIKDAGVIPAVSINPPTPVSAIKDVLEDVGMVLVMSVNPGFSGQSFMPEVLPKVKELRQIIDEKKLNVDIAIDGGVKDDTGKLAKEAGANILSAASFIFKSDDVEQAIKKLKE